MRIVARKGYEKVESKKVILLAMVLLIASSIATSVNVSSVKAATREQIETAVDKGLKWLATQQLADGSWGGYRVASTGLAVLKFETHAVRADIDPLDPSYEYYNQVKNGLNYLFSRAFNVSISIQPAGDPERTTMVRAS